MSQGRPRGTDMRGLISLRTSFSASDEENAAMMARKVTHRALFRTRRLKAVSTMRCQECSRTSVTFPPRKAGSRQTPVTTKLKTTNQHGTGKWDEKSLNDSGCHS